MAWRTTPARRLEVEADRVQGIIELHEYKDTEWELAGFLEAMAERGLDYTNGEIVAIRDELISRGVLEEVP